MAPDAVNVRFASPYGLKADIAPGPKSAKTGIACLKGIPHHALAGIAGGDAGELALKGGSGGPAVQPFLLRRQLRARSRLLAHAEFLFRIFIVRSCWLIDLPQHTPCARRRRRSDR